MEMKWTKEQEQVITLRDRDLLVSAAAGSGKTAVLVERIIARITDPAEPVDIDRLIVVTFTKAAAAEMKERISQAISRLRSERPEDSNLIRQSSLIHNARICTIDSFCSYVVRNYFDTIGLDPDFRIADEGELKLLKEDVLSRLFEEEYQAADPDFLELVDRYSGKQNDGKVKNMIREICQKAESSPWPLRFITKLGDPYRERSAEEFSKLPMIQEEAVHLREHLRMLGERLQKMASLAESSGITKYQAALPEAAILFQIPGECSSLDQIAEFLGGITLKSLPTIYAKDKADPEIKVQIQEGYKKVRADLQSLQVQYGNSPQSTLQEQIVRMRPLITTLTDLSLKYTECLQKEKKKRKIADFSDIEHYALQILVEEQSGEPTEVAQGFRRHFAEIMIDEYQDSNEVQEEILTAISGHSQGRHNMFMVGDVKQSIYRFRQARPELFMEKYHTFSSVASQRQKIELHENFRSRRQVLDFTNDLFYKLMEESLGGISYDDNCALYPGAKFPDEDTNLSVLPELLLADQAEMDQMLEESSQEEENAKQLEGRLIAHRILELMQTMEVSDRKTGEMRPVRYSDMVILLRSLKDWGTDIANVLSGYGIPVHVASSTGYFSAMEVQTILNFLKLLDNPYQDIPMAAVLRSELAGLDDEMLSEIRTRHQDIPFCAAALTEMDSADKDSRLGCFAAKYRHFRELSRELPIHVLIQKILAETGYGDFAAALPGGEQRGANLDMLVEKAIAYEKTSYKGLFHFIRYIDRLREYDVDYGEADMTAENADVVRVMTIHKSKGLEFPIVFVSGIGKGFNNHDINEEFVIHPELGMAMPEISRSPRVKTECLFRSIIRERLQRDSLGEELRVLYVALTRAKEKLILTGTVKDREKFFRKYEGNVLPKVPLSFEVRRSAKCMLDWIVPAVLSYPDKYRIEFVPAERLAAESAREEAEHTIDRASLYTRLSEVSGEEIKKLNQALEFRYPFEEDMARKSKYSVSELKHASMALQYDQQESGAEVPEFLRQEREPYIPSFASESQEESGQLVLNLDPGASPGALRGTAVHRVMECLDFAACREDPSFIREELRKMTDSGMLTEEMRSLVSQGDFLPFLGTGIAARMKKAASEGNLFREKPFVMEHDGVLVQGIIDVFWIEEDGLVIMDYKTDRVKTASELDLRYRTQLELYRDALNQVFAGTGRQVKEILIYSFRLQEVITL